jgi:hypothetical protein
LIFISPEFAEDKPLIEHELVHYREQRNWLVLPWFLAYWLSKDLRFNAEVRGHAAQVFHGGCTVEWAAAHIVNKYHTGKSFAQARDALLVELWGSNKFKEHA